jgi:hypothetical protein
MVMMRLALAFALGAALLSQAAADDASPARVRTCADVRAYIGADGTMTMDRFKALMRATESGLSDRGAAALDDQCKATAYVKQVIMSQQVYGTPARVGTKLVSEGGACKLTQIALEGC